MKQALAVIDSAFEAGAEVMAPLFSGGHDSLTATFIASFHPKFTGDVFHINTGIGAKATRAFVEDVCKEYGWTLHVKTSPSTYESFIRSIGFPGPGMHHMAYARLKERCVRMIMRDFGKAKVALITGCRSAESERRMGHVEPLKIGEIAMKKKQVKGLFDSVPVFEVVETLVNRRRYWVSPCHAWLDQDQQCFMSEQDLPRNPLKDTPLAMSGECMCGSFGRPHEIAMVRRYAPDVATEIDRLTIIAIKLGKHSKWGTRPAGEKGIIIAKSGPLCNSCDARAMAAGLIIDQREMQCDLHESDAASRIESEEAQ